MRFWLNRGTQPEGPLEEAAISQLIATGLRAANVCPEGGQAWQPLASHPPFAAALSAAAAPPMTPVATLGGQTTPASLATSSVPQASPPFAAGSPLAPAAGPALDPSDPRIAAHVARGFSTPFTRRLVVQSLFVAGYTVAALFFLAQGRYPTSSILLVYGVAVLGVGLHLGRYRVVGTPKAIGTVLGWRHSWADLEGPQRMRFDLIRQSRRGVELSRSVRLGLRLHFRGGKKLELWDDWKVGLEERLEAYAAMAAALAQPARAPQLLALPSVRTVLEADAGSTARAPVLGGGLPALVGCSLGLLVFASGGAMHFVEASRHAAALETERAARAAAEAAAEAERAAAAAYSTSHPRSPGLGALAPEGVCPLLGGWGYECEALGEPPPRGAVPPWHAFTVAIGDENLRVRLVDYAALPSHRVLDEFAVSVIVPPGVDPEPILDALTHHPITGWDSFEAAVRRTRYRLASGTRPRGGFGFVCESFPATHRDETIEVSECNWALVSTGATSMRVSREGDRLLVVENVRRPRPDSAPGVERLRDVLLGTATP